MHFQYVPAILVISNWPKPSTFFHIYLYVCSALFPQPGLRIREERDGGGERLLNMEVYGGPL